VEIRRGGEADIPFIMATERIAGYEHLVGRHDEAQHRSALADPRYVYFIGCEASDPVGFAILRDWGSPERVVYVKRIAVCRPGAGLGRRFLAEIVGAVFRETDAHRIWLGLFPENERARRAYAAAGFKAEGISRGSAFFGGVNRDELVMALLRPEWAARHASPG
jgi:diamine N-acetyltransferase